MTDFVTPVGRFVQGSLVMQQEIDYQTKQKKVDRDGNPVMGIFFTLAFPKRLPNGQENTEFNAFWATLNAAAQQAWPHLFQNGQCTNPRFSWKYQDGDGHDSNGQSVASKPGFAGHHLVKFSTSYDVRCFYENKFAPHEQIQQVQEVIKRGYWIRVMGEVKSNNAEGTQVPGIAIYPKLVSFVARDKEISTGPDAAAAFGAVPTGWRPEGDNSPMPMPGAAPAGLPTPGQVGAPAVGAPMGLPTPGQVGAPMPAAAPGLPALPVAAAPTLPTYGPGPNLPAGLTVEAAMATPGYTVDALIAGGYIVRTA